MASPSCVKYKTLKNDTVEWCDLCWEWWDMEHGYMEELVKLRHDVVELRERLWATEDRVKEYYD